MNENNGQSMSALLRSRLKARVHHIEANAGMVKVVTIVTIIAGDTLEIAHARLGGSYNEQQALREYERFPERFTKGKAHFVTEDHRPVATATIEAQTAAVEQGELVTA